MKIKFYWVIIFIIFNLSFLVSNISFAGEDSPEELIKSNKLISGKVSLYFEPKQSSEFFFCTHTDLRVGNSIWNFWGNLHRRHATYRVQDVENSMKTGHLRPIYKINLNVTAKEFQSLENLLTQNEGVPKTQTCAGGITKALGATTGIRIPRLAGQSPLALAAYFKALQTKGDPRIESIEELGSPSLCTSGVAIESAALLTAALPIALDALIYNTDTPAHIAYKREGEPRFLTKDKEGKRYTSIRFPEVGSIQFFSSEANTVIKNLKLGSRPPRKLRDFQCGIYRCSELEFKSKNEKNETERITVYTSDVRKINQVFGAGESIHADKLTDPLDDDLYSFFPTIPGDVLTF